MRCGVFDVCGRVHVLTARCGFFFPTHAPVACVERSRWGSQRLHPVACVGRVVWGFQRMWPVARVDCVLLIDSKLIDTQLDQNLT